MLRIVSPAILGHTLKVLLLEPAADGSELRLERLRHRYLPAADVVIEDAWAGLYDMTPDAHPILGRVGEGVYAACGFSGHGFMQSPAVVPVHDPALITTLPGRQEWYHLEGCGHLSVEAFWQMSKVVEVRYDRFLAAGEARADPLGSGSE